MQESVRIIYPPPVSGSPSNLRTPTTRSCVAGAVAAPYRRRRRPPRTIVCSISQLGPVPCGKLSDREAILQGHQPRSLSGLSVGPARTRSTTMAEQHQNRIGELETTLQDLTENEA